MATVHAILVTDISETHENMTISIQQLLGDRESLAGAITGRQAFAKLLQLVEREPAAPEVLYLDFTGVQLASASFLREAILHFRDAVRRRGSKFYPVVANANDLVIEELEVLLANRRDVLMHCSVDRNGDAGSQRLLGDLDPKQRTTLEEVLQRQETDAGELMNAFGESEGVRQTAFNNRLTALAEMGLVIEVSHGRLKRYRALFQRGVAHGA